MEVRVQLHASALCDLGNSHLYPLDMKLFGPRASMVVLVNGIMFYPYQESNPGSSSTYLTELSWCFTISCNNLNHFVFATVKQQVNVLKAI
jgi:hypothetical protein